MQIEYDQTEYANHAGDTALWVAKIGDKEVCRILGGMVADNWHIVAFDTTNPEPQKIPGSPFESLNKAKAVIEYHYRLLL